MQVLRFALVGLGSNLLLFGAYLLLTAVGVRYLAAVVVSYALGILMSFVSNKSWTFRYRGAGRKAFARYLAVYLCGLGLNLLVLYVLVERFALPHPLCQGVLVLVFAATFFLLQKFWIFPAQQPADAPRAARA